MPITLTDVDGLIDASVIDDNFTELENLLKEGVSKEDFNGKFTKFKIRRYTSGKIVSFNTGSNPYSSPRDAEITGTFENNWTEGTPESKLTNESDINKITLSVGSSHDGKEDNPDAYDYSINEYPMEFLGFPGSTLMYDFQEQGIPNPSQLATDLGTTLTNWPPGQGAATTSHPDNQCWSRWLTVPDCAGGVYVDEPCVAIITATVRGNYFFTPALRVHGINTDVVYRNTDFDIKDEEGGTVRIKTREIDEPSGLGLLMEGQDQSAFLRLGLFVDTNPIVHDDEFTNGDDYGNLVKFASGELIGHGYNPWIGSNAKGELQNTRPDNVAATRSWVKVKEVTYRVRQRNTYQLVAAIELKGRKKYNFSLKFRPAGYYGWVGFGKEDQSDPQQTRFIAGYHEFGKTGFSGVIDPYAHKWTGDGEDKIEVNPTWVWGGSTLNPAETKRPWHVNWLYPGTDALVTNFVESSSLGVEFLYGATLSDKDNLSRFFRHADDKNTE
tara:strand:- start:198 stop:1688 length:1491 start_codon:yes stop_codon:yes gene_type:complete